MGQYPSIFGNMYLIPFYYATSFYFKIFTVLAIIQSATYVCFILLLYCYLPSARRALAIFILVGRMAFTNYIFQTFAIL
ncbi:MAG TPA: DUF418 domain-containing protein [Candidatus Sphingobacterium stercoripullorum]|uniref:DUF418 domain-containing protein n=1 Tax=Candidatus Sphingobacterium stercoripullorum TaxID=2838759 RepID=A0A9D1WAU9_9SPHI|nr:DUF418 domain-containing protein [Candidatus Sphingobacterium stercoripullorum]